MSREHCVVLGPMAFDGGRRDRRGRPRKSRWWGGAVLVGIFTTAATTFSGVVSYAILG